MELTYILIAALIVILPFVLVRLFSAGSKEPRTAQGTKPSQDDAANAAAAAELAAMAAAAREAAERRAKNGGS